MEVSKIEYKIGKLEILRVGDKNKYVVKEPFELTMGKYYICVHEGFMSDGCTRGPDVGYSWLFHDFLYDTHKTDLWIPCTREEADNIMLNILNYEISISNSFFEKCKLWIVKCGLLIAKKYYPNVLQKSWDD
uniref:Uncharacterized protein n=1 Tax=Pithovirus LCPAC001 TaxID=2506585 RepID=A0A481Z3V6_9VIRU|nr:MAG: uncharacterized protein LCPAC001_01690 [Pithovirus LCPAC001]